MFVFALIN